jgi:hypothetical protein
VSLPKPPGNIAAPMAVALINALRDTSGMITTPMQIHEPTLAF